LVLTLSVALATFNGAAFLREQLDSLAAQTRPPDELVIGDDGSSDETEQIVAQFKLRAPFPVHFHRNERRLGYGENFVLTARRCTGKWIAFSDQDDVWSPSKLAWAESRIAAGPESLQLLAHDAMVSDVDRKARRVLYGYRGERLTPRLQLAPEWYCAGFTQIFRAELIEMIPWGRRVSFPWHDHREAHDVWIALLANCTGSILRSDAVLADYRSHSGATTVRSKSPEPLDYVGDSYLERADYLREVATTLNQIAPVSDAQYQVPLRDAADRIARQSTVLRTRSEAYLAPTLSVRLKSIAQLVRSGAYIGRLPWRFGTRRLIKDTLCAVGIL
jgi:glycosyltransferase involved in cell wall biosynthesis